MHKLYIMHCAEASQRSVDSLVPIDKVLHSRPCCPVARALIHQWRVHPVTHAPDYGVGDAPLRAARVAPLHSHCRASSNNSHVKATSGAPTSCHAQQGVHILSANQGYLECSLIGLSQPNQTDRSTTATRTSSTQAHATGQAVPWAPQQ